VKGALTMHAAGLTVSFGAGLDRFRALNSVTVGAALGQTVAVIGPSGSGKSVLAEALSGQQSASGRMSSGQVLYNGEDLFAYSEKKHRQEANFKIGYARQNLQHAFDPVIPLKTQFREMTRIAASPKTPKGAIDEAVERLLATLGIANPAEVLAKPARDLNLDELRLACLAMAFASRPEVILFDEPEEGLSTTQLNRALFVLREQVRSGLACAFVMTRDPAVACSIADYAYVLYKGEVIECGPIEDIMEKPYHPFTANLLRCMPAYQRKKGRKTPFPVMADEVEDDKAVLDACAYAGICAKALKACIAARPSLIAVSKGHGCRCIYAREAPPIGLESDNESARRSNGE